MRRSQVRLGLTQLLLSPGEKKGLTSFNPFCTLIGAKEGRRAGHKGGGHFIVGLQRLLPRPRGLKLVSEFLASKKDFLLVNMHYEEGGGGGREDALYLFVACFICYRLGRAN